MATGQHLQTDACDRANNRRSASAAPGPVPALTLLLLFGLDCHGEHTRLTRAKRQPAAKLLRVRPQCSGFPRSSRASRTARTTGWWHRRSSKADRSAPHGPPAHRGRWSPPAPTRHSRSVAAAMGASPPRSDGRLSTIPPPPSIAPTCRSVTPISPAACLRVISFLFAFFRASSRSRSACFLSSCPWSTASERPQ